MWTKTRWKDERNSLWEQGPQQLIVHLSPCLEPPTAQQFNSISKMKLKWKQAAGECWVSSCWHYPWRCSDHDREVRMGWTEGWWEDKTGSHTSKSCRLPAVVVNMSILFYSFCWFYHPCVWFIGIDRVKTLNKHYLTGRKSMPKADYIFALLFSLKTIQDKFCRYVGYI